MTAALATQRAFFELLTASFARLVGSSLVPASCDAGWLYQEALFPVLAHNTDVDPLFTYANRAAQRCFGYSWDEFLGLHSRLSAEAPDRAERQRLLEAVSRDGFVAGYRGLRVAKSGGRFWIEDGIVWQLLDAGGVLHGQAAVFLKWRDA